MLSSTDGRLDRTLINIIPDRCCSLQRKIIAISLILGVTAISLLRSGLGIGELQEQTSNTKVSRSPTSVLKALLRTLESIPDAVRPTVLELTPKEVAGIPFWIESEAPNFIRTRIGTQKIVPVCQNRLRDNAGSGRCCLGATSAGGDQDLPFGARKSCTTQDLSVYQRVRDLALDELTAYPVTESPSSVASSLMACDICRIVYLLASAPHWKHRRLAIVGDSVQRQSFRGMECELRRRGFVVGNITVAPFKRDTTKTPPGRIAWKYGPADTYTCYTVIVPGWMSKIPAIAHGSRLATNEVTVCFYGHYRPLLDMEQHRTIALESDLMIVSYALHYNSDDKDEIKKELGDSYGALLGMFRNNQTLSESCKLIFRETSAQHFPENGGEYTPNGHTRVKAEKKCFQLERPDITWRRQALHKAANTQDYDIVDSYGNSIPIHLDGSYVLPPRRNTTQQHTATSHTEAHRADRNRSRTRGRHRTVTILPFYNFTSRLHDLHNTNDSDCTHFCYTPHLWSPLWRHLRIAMDRMATTKREEIFHGSLARN